MLWGAPMRAGCMSWGCQRDRMDGGSGTPCSQHGLPCLALCCGKEKSCSRTICVTKPCVLAQCWGLPSCPRRLGLSRTLTPESPACAFARCAAQTGSGTGSRQTRRLCQRKQGGNRSGCRREPVWEEKTSLWAGQQGSPFTVLLHIKYVLFPRLKRSSPEKEEDLGRSCPLWGPPPRLGEEQQQDFKMVPTKQETWDPQGSSGVRRGQGWDCQHWLLPRGQMGILK